jgi:hypothetical protein
MVVFFDTSDPPFLCRLASKIVVLAVFLLPTNLCAMDGSVANRAKGLYVFLSFSGSEWAGYSSLDRPPQYIDDT